MTYIVSLDIKVFNMSINIVMEYAISIAVVAVFIAVYILTRPKMRPLYFETYGDMHFSAYAKEYIKNLPLPKEGSKNEGKSYAGKIKHIMRKLKKKRYGEFFEAFTALEDEIKAILKTDFTPLDGLPSIDGEPRAVKLARLWLAHSDYMFCEDRVMTVIEEQNRCHTLSFSEISAMKQASKYVLIEKLCYVYLQLDTLARVHTLAAKYVYNPVLLSTKYRKLARSKLFLSICALRAGYKMEYFSELHADVISTFKDQIKSILKSVKQADEFDFSRLYTPLEILDKFEVFAEAPPDVKKNFLMLIQEESDRENLDEFMYTIRLEKYMQSASAGHIALKRINVLSRTVCLIKQKRDIAMLATALSSRHFMNLYFAPNKIARGINEKSITKTFEYESTFEPIYKFHTVNFGISIAGGKLRVSPSLPKQIDSADIAFTAYGVQNTLHIRRGESKELYIGNTLISGIDQIRLGDKPLDITVKLPQ